MSLYDNFPQETLVDLLRAYDSYIITAADAGLLTTGWTPVSVEEFYDHEYQNVWDKEKGDESFYYMYDNAEAMVRNFDQETKSTPLLAPQSVAVLDGAQIIREMTNLFCQFPGEEMKRPLRSRIQDIKEGDTFLVPSSFNTLLVRQAAYDAHQNLDEKDEPWIVYDIADDCWFEEDISNAERVLNALQYGKAEKTPSTGLPVNLVNIIRERPCENEEWIDSFWVDAKEVPTVDLFRAAVGDFLRTKDGIDAMEASFYDFNWGDAMMYVPQDIWKKHGIYPVDLMHPPAEMGLVPAPNNNPVTFTVDQDERLYSLGHADTFAESLVFDDEIYVSDEATQCADAYLMSTKLLRERFIAEVEPQLDHDAFWSMENINFYAMHDIKDGSVSLEATFWCTENGKETQKSCTIPLSEDEKAALVAGLDAYCQTRYGRDLKAYINECRKDLGLAPLESGSTTKPTLDAQIGHAEQRTGAGQPVENAPTHDPQR